MELIKNYPQKTFEHAVVAVDIVIFSVIQNKLNVLLLQLKDSHSAGLWALPGGLLHQNESLETSVERHLENKTGIKSLHTEQLYTFGEPSRDPNGWVVSVAYLALVADTSITPKTTDRYSDIKWQPVDSLPALAYDHTKIISVALDRLRSKITYTNIVYSLMPEEFTLTQLQQMYEIILGSELDKRNFRKKILALGLLTKLSKKKAGEANRPAQLYCFSDKTPKVVEIL